MKQELPFSEESNLINGFERLIFAFTRSGIGTAKNQIIPAAHVRKHFS